MAVRVSKNWHDSTKTTLAYSTAWGKCYQSSIESFVDASVAKAARGKVRLIFTSPPFPLASPKSYGNSVGEKYVTWLTEVFESVLPLMMPKGSLVVEIGNSWDKGSPTMSLAPLETLIAISKNLNLHVCQQFIAHNPNRLPSPIVYVNKERNRVKDSFTHVWWFSKSPRPYANNRNVLREYSPAMKRLLARGSYNPGRRPSEHTIGERSFLVDNGGAIPSNVLEFGGSKVDKNYRQWCAAQEIKQHPAKMAEGLAEFFVRFLSKENELVFDPFGGSNTTGSVAESLKRRWLTVERDFEYVKGSIGRFGTPKL